MWLKYPALCFDPSPKPTTIEDALRSDYPWRYLTVPQIRELAIDLGVMPGRNRETFVELLLSTGATEEIVGAAMAGYF